MKTVIGLISLLFSFLLPSLLLSACASGGVAPVVRTPTAIQQRCSASLLSLDGSRTELSEITSASFLFKLLARDFGVGTVELKPSAVEKVTLTQGTGLYEIQFRDFIPLTGNLIGSLGGLSAQGDYRVEWKNIREAAISCDPVQVEYFPPPGVEADFYDEAGTLHLYGLKVVQSYCTPSGEPAGGYQLCIEGQTPETVLRVNASQDGNVYIGYAIPLDYLTSISVAGGIQYQSPLLGPQTLRGEFHTSWALRPEGSMMHFQGENALGTWKIVPTGNFRVDFTHPAPTGPISAAPEPLGTCTTPDGETLGIVAEQVGSIQLRIEDSPAEVPWQDIRQMKLWREHSWLSDPLAARFWQPVEITMLDGQVIQGDAYLPEGFITAIRPDGVQMNIPLYGLLEIDMDR